MEKLNTLKTGLQKILLYIFLITGGNCFGQITSCGFLLNNGSVCSPVTLSAAANEVWVSQIVARSWYITTCSGTAVFDTTISANASFTHVIVTPGCYCLRLRSIDQNGDTCSYQQCNISVAANPVVDFAFEHTTGCLPLSVGAQCNSQAGSGTIDSVVIDWGCIGRQSYNACMVNPVSATYASPTCTASPQTVSVLVKNSLGCISQQSYPNVINITPVPAANFEVAHTFCFGSEVCVRDTDHRASDSIIGIWYDFGDGHTVNGPDNCYMYPVAGSYNITLIENDNLGCSDTIVKPVVVFPLPVANFSISDTVICSNEQICLTDLSTSSVQITNWLWSYGDNSGSSLSSPPCHHYISPFNYHYTISLIVTDQNNCSDSVAVVETVNKIPQAGFNWTRTCENELTRLESTSSGIGGALRSCQWLFWVGALSPVTDNNYNTSFQFPAGTHDVQLVVTDVNGCTDTVVESVITDSLSTLILNPNDTTICYGTSIDYHLSGVFNHVSWENNIWIDSSNLTGANISPLGDVTYTVNVKNGTCAAVSDSFKVEVIQPVPITLSATPGQIVVGLKSNITSQIEGQIDSIRWTPDTALTCNNCPDPIAYPNQTTTYTATIFYARNGISCSNSASVTIDVLNNCGSGIIYAPNTFTPNGDGLNDVFMIRGLAATKINYFRVWDRLGTLVFNAMDGVPNSPQFGWDGTDRQGKKLNPDVYVYTYEIQCINGNIVTGQGNVTLAR